MFSCKLHKVQLEIGKNGKVIDKLWMRELKQAFSKEAWSWWGTRRGAGATDLRKGSTTMELNLDYHLLLSSIVEYTNSKLIPLKLPTSPIAVVLCCEA